MSKIFTLILVSATLMTALLWCLNKFIIFLKQRAWKFNGQSHEDDQLNSTPLKKKSPIPNWVQIGASFFPVLLIVLLVRSFVYEPFQIPSGSMMPTLLIGDFILIEKFAYGIKDPIYQKTLIKTGHPNRGDIVVFKYPNNPSLAYIKRVMGLPGDKVIYDPVAKKVTVHPSWAPSRTCTNVLPITYINIKPSDFVQSFSYLDGAVINSSFLERKGRTKEYGIRLIEHEEILGFLSHRILTVPIVQDQLSMYYQQPGQQLATWVVPSGHYFVLGDNRDNSSDSRYWGFVPEANLVGKATAIWMSFKKHEGKWPTGIRLNRIGRIH